MMKTAMRKQEQDFVFKVLAGAVLLFALAACGDADRDTEQRTDSAPQTSIMRDDLDDSVLPAPELQLAPLEARISFSDGGSELSESAQAELTSILRSPQMAKGGAIILRAHSDAGGSGDGNLRASQMRGEAVRDFLVENGVDEERITIIAFGEQNPIQPNALPDGTPNEPGRAANRRVDLTIAIPSRDEASEEEADSEEETAEDGATQGEARPGEDAQTAQ